MGEQSELDDLLIGFTERDERSAYFNLHPDHELRSRLYTREVFSFDEPGEGEYVTSAAVFNGVLGYHIWRRVGDDWVSPSGYVATWSGISTTLSQDGHSTRIRAWKLTCGARNAEMPLAMIAVPAHGPSMWIESEPAIFTPYGDASSDRRLTMRQIFDDALEFRWA